MAYPIIEKPVNVGVIVNSVTNITDYVTQINGSVGSRPSVTYADLEPGECSIELRDAESNATVEAALLPGATVNIVTADGAYIFAGKIRDVDVTYAWDATEMRLVSSTTLSVFDFVSNVANKEIPANSFTAYTGREYMTYAEMASIFNTKTGFTFSGMPATGALNQFTEGINALELVNTVARSGAYRAYATDTVVALADTVAPTVYDLMVTDGTHTAPFSGTMWGMTDLNYGYSSKNVLTELNFSNKCLSRYPKVANDPAVEDVDIPYTVTQTITGFNAEATIETINPTGIATLNALKNTGSSAVSPRGIWPTDYVTWSSSTALTLNGHPVAAGIVNTAWSSRALPVIELDVQDNFITTWPSTDFGNWIFQFKSRTVTSPSHSMGARIVWYNSAGTVLRTDTGSFTNVANAAWVTHTVSVATPPAGATTAVAYVVSNTAQAVGYQFYVTEACFSRATYGSTFFDGNTTDTTNYLYSWTGAEGSSRTMLNHNTLKTLGDTILARNVVQKTVKSVTINMQEVVAPSPLGFSDITVACLALYPIVIQAQTNITAGLKICINAVTGNYRLVGYDFNITPTSFTSTLHVVKH